MFRPKKTTPFPGLLPPLSRLCRDCLFSIGIKLSTLLFLFRRVLLRVLTPYPGTAVFSLAFFWSSEKVNTTTMAMIQNLQAAMHYPVANTELIQVTHMPNSRLDFVHAVGQAWR